MNKLIGLFGLGLMKKNSMIAPATTEADRPPHPYFITAQGHSVTETINILRERETGRAFEEISAAFVPALRDNLVTRAAVKWAGREDKIAPWEPIISSPVTGHEVALTAIGRVNLSVNFHRGGNERKTWDVTFVVVEEIWADTDLLLGEALCEKAEIVRGDQICPYTIKKISKGNCSPSPTQDTFRLCVADLRALLEEERQREEEYKKSLERAEAKMAADDRERLAKEDKKADEARVQSKKT